jgi:hypothetical protein
MFFQAAARARKARIARQKMRMRLFLLPQRGYSDGHHILLWGLRRCRWSPTRGLWTSERRFQPNSLR